VKKDVRSATQRNARESGIMWTPVRLCQEGGRKSGSGEEPAIVALAAGQVAPFVTLGSREGRASSARARNASSPNVPEHIHRQVRVKCLQRGLLVRDYIVERLARDGIK
jgi:hypothetical protein